MKQNMDELKDLLVQLELSIHKEDSYETKKSIMEDINNFSYNNELNKINNLQNKITTLSSFIDLKLRPEALLPKIKEIQEDVKSMENGGQRGN